jgi:hypothetical protein
MSIERRITELERIARRGREDLRTACMTALHAYEDGRPLPEAGMTPAELATARCYYNTLILTQHDRWFTDPRPLPLDGKP